MSKSPSFELPVEKEISTQDVSGKTYYRIINANKQSIAAGLTEKNADYIVQAINSHEKIQIIISRLERNRNTERLNSEATEEPSKSFWRGQAEKASEVIIWLEQILKEAGEPKNED